MKTQQETFNKLIAYKLYYFNNEYGHISPIISCFLDSILDILRSPQNVEERYILDQLTLFMVNDTIYRTAINAIPDCKQRQKITETIIHICIYLQKMTIDYHASADVKADNDCCYDCYCY